MPAAPPPADFPSDDLPNLELQLSALDLREALEELLRDDAQLDVITGFGEYSGSAEDFEYSDWKSAGDEHFADGGDYDGGEGGSDDSHYWRLNVFYTVTFYGSPDAGGRFSACRVQ
jgi:hypothetical protein